MKPLVEGSDVPLLERYDAALFDLDGVLYVGAHAVEGAAEAVAAIRRSGIRVAFVTNNASRTPETVADHLVELGITAAPEDVVTSAQAAVRLVADVVPPGSPVLVVGGAGLEAALREQGLEPVSSVEDQPVAVVQGFAPEVGWRLLAEGTYAVRSGLPWVASNLDITVPTARGLAPGNGTLVGVIAQATGRTPVAAGKPETPLHREALRRTRAERPLVIGDRLDTDIDGANRAGAESLLVLTGVTTPVDLVLARRGLRPTFVAEGLLEGLLEPHPSVQHEPGGQWSCGNWRCHVDHRSVQLEGEGDRLDALRALSVASWRSGRDLDPPEVRSALARAGW